MRPSLDHIAVAVDDLDQAQRFYEDAGLVFEQEREEVPSEGVLTAFAPLGGGARLELLAALGEGGPVAKFLAKRGPGVHHICLRVSDVAKEGQRLQDLGHRLVYEAPVPGAGGCLVNFVHPASTGGVLVELSQPQAP